ncbi:hypothetical protein BH09VER1_BH09VER1_12160 [soil metagenome]
MKNATIKAKRFAIIAIVAALSAAALPAQEEMPANKEAHRELMPMHVMMEEMQARQDAEIDKLLAKMNAATGEKKVDAIAAVVTKLVEQRKIMHAKMAAMLDR